MKKTGESRAFATVIALAAFVLASAVSADNVYLKNGRVYTRCRASYTGDGNVKIVMPGGTLILPETAVAYIEKEEVADEELEASAEPVLSPALKAIMAAKDATENKKLQKGKDPMRQRITPIIELFKDPDEGIREQAVMSLLEIGNKAVPYLVERLGDSDTGVRYHVSKVLFDLKPREAIKPILEAIYAASPADGPAPFFLEPYLATLRDTLRAATGQYFNYQPNSRLPGQPQAVKKWIEWYNANWESLTPQIGEPELDKDDPEYKEKFKKARALQLVRRQFTPPGYEGTEETTEELSP